MANREKPVVPHNIAYPRWKRVRHAYKFIITMAHGGKLEITQSRFVASTYGLPQNLIKRMKMKQRNELSFGDGK